MEYFLRVESIMRLLMVWVAFLAGAAASGQTYRLAYDPATIPELYHTTHIYLEERAGGGFEEIRGRYRISSEDADLDGMTITYSPAALRAAGGKLRFSAQIRGEQVPLTLTLPLLQELRFNLYTDSIKPILNFYVNIEGIFSSGRIFPLTEEHVTVSSDVGTMKGLEWIPPANRNFDRVVFQAVSRADPSISRTITVYLKRQADPRDAEGYEDHPGDRPRR